MIRRARQPAMDLFVSHTNHDPPEGLRWFVLDHAQVRAHGLQTIPQLVDMLQNEGRTVYQIRAKPRLLGQQRSEVILLQPRGRRRKRQESPYAATTA